MNLIQFTRDSIDTWSWYCHCGAELAVEWHTSGGLYDTDEPIEAQDAWSSSWEVVCTEGHTLLCAHEVDENQTADSYPAPTTGQIVEKLGSPEDVAAWREYCPNEAVRLAENRATWARAFDEVGPLSIELDSNGNPPPGWEHL